jgi:iron complex transport system substrate-binding protein
LIRTVTVLVLVGAGCRSEAPVPSSVRTDCVTAFDPSVDYFPDKVRADHARFFDVSYHGHYKVLEVRFRGFTDNPRFESRETYVLVQCGAPTPPLEGPLAGAHVLEVPARTVTVTTNEDLGLITALGMKPGLKSVGSRSIYPQDVWDEVRAGVLPVTGGWGAEGPQLELLASLAPDVVVIGAFHSEASVNLRRVRQAGLETLPSLVRMEANPLGRAEWLKAISLVFNREGRANELFDRVERDYLEVSRKARARVQKPLAFWGSTYSAGLWGVGRNNFQARLLEDAGAANVLADDGPTHVVMVGAEVVVDRGARADFWITEGLRDLPGARPGELRARQLGRVYYVCRLYRAENAGCDYYHTSPHRPDVMLRDLVSVFHPDLVPGHEPYFLINSEDEDFDGAL